MTEPNRYDAIRAIAYLVAIVRPDWDRPGRAIVAFAVGWLLVAAGIATAANLTP